MRGGHRSFMPRAMSRFWLRRLCEAGLFVSMGILVLYAWARFLPTGYDLPIGLAVDNITAGVAAFVSIMTFILCLWLPQKKMELVAATVYLSIVGTIVTLIATSGGITSPFLNAWMVVALFAGFFGPLIVTLMILLVLTHLALGYFEAVELTTLLTQLFFGAAPLLLSFVLWHRQPKKKNDTSLADLANKLSTVEGKSDVVINVIGDGVMAINRSGVIDLINPSAQALVGWSKGDALGLDWRSVLKLINDEGREVEEADNPVAKALTNGKPTHSEKFSLTTEGGKKRLISIVSSPVGQNEGIIVVFRDITKEKAEEREQAEFISTASHEMRTPVASIEGYLGLALNPATANIDEKARDFITKAHESAQHLGRLFQDLLDISKAEDGRLKSEPQIIDVSAMTGSITEGLVHLAEQKQLRVLFKPNPSYETDSGDRRMQPVYYTHVDPNHFREVVSNLIENAIKYTLQGDVTIDVAGDEKLVTISVQDTGVGIPKEDIPHLFQKFYRVDNSDTREIGGTGLGLYLCRKLTESMGGNLRVESEHKKGSTFFLDIPRTSHEEAMEKLSEMPEEEPMRIVADRPALPMPDEEPAATGLIEAPEPVPPVPTTSPAAPPAPVPTTPSQVAQQPEMTLQDIETTVAEQPAPTPPALVAMPTPEQVVAQPAPAPPSTPTIEQPVAPQPEPVPTPIPQAPTQPSRHSMPQAGPRADTLQPPPRT